MQHHFDMPCSCGESKLHTVNPSVVEFVGELLHIANTHQCAVVGIISGIEIDFVGKSYPLFGAIQEAQKQSESAKNLIALFA